jgi:hypothetical protein
VPKFPLFWRQADAVGGHPTQTIICAVYPRSYRAPAPIYARANWTGMWRVRFGGKLSDMANFLRAKDAAISMVLHELNTSRLSRPLKKTERPRFSILG